MRYVSIPGLAADIPLPEDAIGACVNGVNYLLSEDKLTLIRVCDLCGGSGELLGAFGESMVPCPCQDARAGAVIKR